MTSETRIGTARGSGVRGILLARPAARGTGYDVRWASATRPLRHGVHAATDIRI